jgi:RNA polymerase sigma-70 factor (ECF subfamily)
MGATRDPGGWDEASDEAIVRAVLAGDTERYAVLVRRYRDRYARYAARMLDSVDAAEDAVQDAFVRAFDQLARCRSPERFAGWFFLILRNRCYAERRRTRRRGPAPETIANDLASGDRPDRETEQGELRQALYGALGVLTAEQREVFVLKHVEGLSYGEIAGLIGGSVPSLKMRMHRAYDRLRHALRDHA